MGEIAISGLLKIFCILFAAAMAAGFPAFAGHSGPPALELVENTDDCLVECHTIYRFSRHPGKAAANDFDLYFYDRTGTKLYGYDAQGMKKGSLSAADFHLEDYRVYYGYNHTFMVDTTPATYREESRYYLLNNKNETNETCVDYGYKTHNSTHCVYQIKIPETYNQERRWEYVWTEAGDRRGMRDVMSAVPDNDHIYIRIEGRKKPMLGDNNIDNVLRIGGYEWKQYAWWNSSWNKRDCFDVQSENGTNLTDWQFPVNVTYDSDMHANFSDVVFVANDTESQVDFCLHDKSDSNYADYWVEGDIDTTNTTYCIYYGNDDKTASDSNCEDTFLFYMNGSSDRTGEFTVLSDSSYDDCSLTYNATTEAHELSPTDDWCGYYVSGGDNYTDVEVNATIDFDFDNSDVDGAPSKWFAVAARLNTTGTGNYKIADNDYGTNNGPRIGKRVGGSETWLNTSLTQATNMNLTHTVSIQLFGDTFYGTWFNSTDVVFYNDSDTDIGPDAHHSYYGIRAVKHGVSSLQIFRMYNMTVRKFYEPEPTVYSFEGEESSNSAPTIDSTSTSPATVYTDTDLSANVTCTDPDSGDTITAYMTEVYIDDAAQSLTNSTAVTNDTSTTVYTLTSGNFSKDETIIFGFICGDGTSNSSATNTSGVTVSNSAPEWEDLYINPIGSAYTTDNLQMVVSCKDDDGDSITGFIEEIYIDDVAQGMTNSTSVPSLTATQIYNLTSGNFSKEENITFQWTCGDGTDNMTSMNESKVISNSAPTIDANTTSPADVYTDTDFLVNITCSDADAGDTITAYIDDVYIDDAAQGLINSTTVTNGTTGQIYSLDSGNFTSGQSIIAEINCGDGTDNATVGNTTSVTTKTGLSASNQAPENNSIQADYSRTFLVLPTESHTNTFRNCTLNIWNSTDTLTYNASNMTTITNNTNISWEYSSFPRNDNYTFGALCYDNENTSLTSANSTFNLTDTTSPTVTCPSGLDVQQNHDGTLQYIPYDTNPAAYNLTINGTEYQTGSWTSGTTIDIPVNSSDSVGTYNYTFQAEDLASNSVQCEIEVNILEDTGGGSGGSGSSVAPATTNITAADYPISRLEGEATSIIPETAIANTGIFMIILAFILILGHKKRQKIKFRR